MENLLESYQKSTKKILRTSNGVFDIINDEVNVKENL